MRVARVTSRMDEAYFRQRYDEDAANQGKQSWKEYQDWVRAFYEGKRFPPVSGWNDQRKDILKTVPAERQGALAPLLDETGRELAAEWAKDNAVRKVSTGDLQAWGSRFSSAAKEPASLEAALREVRAEVQRRRGGA